MSWTLDVTASEDRVEERAETWFAKVDAVETLEAGQRDRV